MENTRRRLVCQINMIIKRSCILAFTILIPTFCVARSGNLPTDKEIDTMSFEKLNHKYFSGIKPSAIQKCQIMSMLLKKIKSWAKERQTKHMELAEAQRAMGPNAHPHHVLRSVDIALGPDDLIRKKLKELVDMAGKTVERKLFGKTIRIQVSPRLAQGAGALLTMVGADLEKNQSMQKKKHAMQTGVAGVSQALDQQDYPTAIQQSKRLAQNLPSGKAIQKSNRRLEQHAKKLDSVEQKINTVHDKLKTGRLSEQQAEGQLSSLIQQATQGISAAIQESDVTGGTPVPGDTLYRSGAMPYDQQAPVTPLESTVTNANRAAAQVSYEQPATTLLNLMDQSASYTVTPQGQQAFYDGVMNVGRQLQAVLPVAVDVLTQAATTGLLNPQQRYTIIKNSMYQTLVALYAQMGKLKASVKPQPQQWRRAPSSGQIMDIQTIQNAVQATMQSNVAQGMRTLLQHMQEAQGTTTSPQAQDAFYEALIKATTYLKEMIVQTSTLLIRTTTQPLTPLLNERQQRDVKNLRVSVRNSITQARNRLRRERNRALKRPLNRPAPKQRRAPARQQATPYRHSYPAMRG